MHTMQSWARHRLCSSRQTVREEEGGKACFLWWAAADMHPLFGFVIGPHMTQCMAIKTACAVLSRTVNYWLITQLAWMSLSVWSAVAAQLSCHSPRAGMMAVGVCMPTAPRITPLGIQSGSHHNVRDMDCSCLDKLFEGLYVCVCIWANTIRENKDLNEQSPAYDLWLYKKTPNKSKPPLLPRVNLFSPLVRSHKSVLGIAVACFQHG